MRGTDPSEETAVEETGEKGTEVHRLWYLKPEREGRSEKRGDSRKSWSKFAS